MNIFHVIIKRITICRAITLPGKASPKTAGFRGATVIFGFEQGLKPKAGEGHQEIYFSTVNGKEVSGSNNPQGLLYINGKIAKGFDINHTEAALEFDKEYDMHIYFYVGMHDGMVEFNTKLKLLDTKIEKLYYHLNVPYEAMLCLDSGGDNYIEIIKHLEIACNLIDFRQTGSNDFLRKHR